MTAYNSSKAAVVDMACAVVVDNGIRVYNVVPGSTNTSKGCLLLVNR